MQSTRCQQPRFRSLLLVFVVGVMAATAGPVRAAEPPELKLLRVTPAGDDVPPPDQIVFAFDRDVVPVGRMERQPSEVPISIEPPLACEWRWLNTTSLACQLREASRARAATRYAISVGELRALDGAVLREPQRHAFLTQRPQVKYAHFDRWLGPELPRTWISFQQPVTLESVESHVFYDVEGQGRVAVDAAEHEQWRGPGYFLTPVRELRADALVTLRVEPGLRSADGPEPGVEARALAELGTFPPLRFLGLRCVDLSGDEILLRPGTEPTRGCDPQRRIGLRFSAPVLKQAVSPHLRADPDFAGGRRDYDPWESVRSRSRLERAHSSGREYEVWLPSPLRAAQRYRLHAPAETLVDEFGRVLDEAVEVELQTDHRRPRSVLSHEVSVLERDADTHLPIVVTNKRSLQLSASRITAGAVEPVERELEIPPALDVAYRFPVPLRDWLPSRSGAFVGRIQTEPAARREKPRRFFSQVTPFQVHLKLGHVDSLVYVTDLASGEPVQGADVELFFDTLTEMSAEPKIESAARTDRDGIARLAGTRTLGQHSFPWRWERRRLMARVRRGDDFALLPALWALRAFERGDGGAWVAQRSAPRYGHVRAWGTTAQGVYRPGDTVEYKLWVRDQDGDGLVPAPRGSYTLEVRDPLDKVVHRETGIELNAFGAHAGELQLSRTAVAGPHRFRLASDFSDRTWPALEVLVSDFTPAPFKVTTELEGERFGPGDAVGVVARAALHSGGPYGNAATRIVARLWPTAIEVSAPRARAFHFQSTSGREWISLHESRGQVDAEGRLAASFSLDDPPVVHGRLVVESAVSDDRGKAIAASASARYLGRDRFVGLHHDGWLLQAGKRASVDTLVIDADGELVGDTEVSVQVEYREVTAARVKGAGNAYVTRYDERWVEVASCTVESALEPASCAFEPQRAGIYRMRAEIHDTGGRPHASEIKRWSQGKGRELWPTEAGYRLDVLPEKTEYRVGETARFLVQNPFAEARALITTERLGVQQTQLRVFRSPTEVVEIEVEPDHVPGFYLSVLATSPRVDAPPGDGDVDLGKPTFRLGYVRVPVRDPVKEIEVDVAVERETYRPRERVRVSLAARTRQGRTPPMELAVAVVDEAVLDLLPGKERSYDPYRGFYALEALDLLNYNLLTRLVGFQRFDKKGDSAGGGGGLSPQLRSLFKFTSYWNPSVELDGQGRGAVEFDVPDNLTGWRVLALAATAADRFGLGQGRFVVNRPTEIRPALPNQVREGDRFQARMTVMNRTPEPRRLEVRIEADGPIDPSPPTVIEVDAPPYQRVPVEAELRAASEGEITLRVAAGDALDADEMVAPVAVRARVAPVTAATYLSAKLQELTAPIEIPADIREDRGALRVVLSPSVIGGIDGAFRYMRDYPYTCWEQRLSKAVMAAHFVALRSYLPADLEWPEAAELPARMLAQAADFQAPGGGMTYYVPRDRHASPYLSAYTALAFVWLRERGHPVPDDVEARLHDYLRALLKRGEVPDFYTEGMSANVRAVALAALARRGVVDGPELRRFLPHMPRMSLFGKAHYLEAAVALRDRAASRATVDAILAHSDQTGGKLRFVEQIDTVHGRLHHTPERATCAILSGLLRLGPGAGVPEDLPFKTVRAISQARKRKDRWENTQENVFCLNALTDYASRFEAERVDFEIETRFEGEALGRAEFDSPRDSPATHARPLGPGDAGRSGAITLHKRGPGRYYAAVQLEYAPRAVRPDPVDAGIEVVREYSVQRDGEWTLLDAPARIRRGELVRVDLYVTVPAARSFVVVDDPLPGGLEAVDRGLATSSAVDADEGEFERAGGSYWYRFNDWLDFATSRWRFYHRELRHDAVRFYSEHLPPGRYTLAYTAQAIAVGDFVALPAHAEEMYDPDVFGKSALGELLVEEPPAGEPQ